jgi:hypothetical protein
MYNSNNRDNHNHKPLSRPPPIKTYYEMTAMSKGSLVSESVTMIQISVQHIGEEPDNMLYAWPMGLTYDSHLRSPYEVKIGHLLSG